MRINYKKLFTPTIINTFNNKQDVHKKIYAMLEYETEMKLGISNEPFKWTLSNITVSTESLEILQAFIYSVNHTKIIVDAESINKLKNKIKYYKYKGKQIYMKCNK